MSAALKMLPRESQTRVGMMSFLIVMASIGYGLLHAFLPASPQPGPVSTAQQPQNADATEAALIDLKLSPHPQFSDKHGGCKLLETVAASGDQAATQRMAMDCRNN